MGRIAIVDGSERVEQEDGTHVKDVKCLPGGRNAVTAAHFADAGDDSLPLPGDAAALEESSGTGTGQVAGYHDPKTPPKAGPGEKRIYARSAPGTASAEIWLQADGSVRIEVFTSATLFIKSPGTVIIDSPDVRVGDETASQRIARVGDVVSGTVRALSAAPGSPIVPVPPATPSPTGGVPFTGKIISGANRSSAS